MPVNIGDGIVGLDASDPYKPESINACFSSVFNAYGPRLKAQEQKASLRATTPVPFNIHATSSANAYQRIPLTVGLTTGVRAPNPDYSAGNQATGITLASDVATIVTSGMYTIIGQGTFNSQDGALTPHSWDFSVRVNGTIVGLPAYGGTNGSNWTQGFVSDTRMLMAGDNVDLWAGVGTDHVGDIRVQDALLTLALNYALVTP